MELNSMILECTMICLSEYFSLQFTSGVRHLVQCKFQICCFSFKIAPSTISTFNFLSSLFERDLISLPFSFTSVRTIVTIWINWSSLPSAVFEKLDVESDELLRITESSMLSTPVITDYDNLTEFLSSHSGLLYILWPFVSGLTESVLLSEIQIIFAVPVLSADEVKPGDQLLTSEAYEPSRDAWRTHTLNIQ